MKRVGLLGCGAIGSEIAFAIDSGKISAKLTHIYDFSKDNSKKLVDKLQNKPVVTENVGLLAASPVDLIIEAASQDAVRDDILSILQNRKDVMIMSVGALLDESIFDIVMDGCRDFNKRVYLPSGAIIGLDGIRAVQDELDLVTLVTTKNPRALKGAKFFETSTIDPDKITTSVVIYEGNAQEAVKLFPANINVAALLSLAGIGSEKTRVKIIADPCASKNTHEIYAEGKFGKFSIKVENVPSPSNPKTSRLATLAAIECLKKICGTPLNIGT
ncbi:aspartate dehydrogenase [Candidatus Nitrosotalea okcheonensis]|uniref:L-aspartate dehydrogenase n=1 Tax=Candidatus Nitrosotalea okcheonensis TaxID=1903276 RepID=A0A2H1FCW7_9ARCH|nr:aspartate dehydrogenase [Candidatus Nitrosotalea okcheonensis]MDE1728139.1 aspartate dehydrogenase [Nitrososphaerota archaeon]MDE1830898.1 aspartate dehydrogenase [Nitrososphaerota archaeon]MDE1877080.1 aspartate dehydrogenase [Nitrososphaerota archaeon]SMH70608.1 putative L-aspartate dehydrogenase [Candidatus Nitrosotalea okcheonensis]